MTVITLAWRISFQGAAIGGLVTTAWFLYGPQTWSVLLLLPLISWAQAQRGRHTAAPLGTGMLLSALLYGLGFAAL